VDKKLFYLSDQFSLHVGTWKKRTNIDMNLFIPNVNTRDFPHTLNFLKDNFPSVLKTQCFNYKNLSFDKEVQATEIGHLFEHILLDQLCIQKIKIGFNKVSYSGRTSWNWEIDKKGIFHISINANKDDILLLGSALKETISLVEKLIKEESILITHQKKDMIDKFYSTDNVEVLPVDLVNG
jgi:hypothetical protein